MSTSIKITSDQKLKKWLDSMPTDCGYELTGFKHDVTRGYLNIRYDTTSPS